MKRVYEKPQIMFEDFSLSVDIAAGCEVSSNFARNECTISLPGVGNVFLEGVAVCQTAIDDGSAGDGICYHVPTDTNNLFAS